MLRVIEYFAKSLKITQDQGHSKWHPWERRKSLCLVFHCNYVCSSCYIWDIQHQIAAWLYIGFGSFKVIDNGTIRKLGYGFLFAFHSDFLSCTISEIKWDIGRKSRFFHTPLHSTSPFVEGSRRNITISFGTERLEWCGYPMVKNLKTRLFVLTQSTNVTDTHTHYMTANIYNFILPNMW